MHAPIRLGIIGAGFIARFHVQSLGSVRDVVVGGVQSRTRASAEGLAAYCNEGRLGEPSVFDSAEELCASDEIDVVWILAPNDVRIEVMEGVVRGNARRAKPLLGIACEKPLARTLAEAERMVELAQEAAVPTGYLENMIFVPALERGKEILWRRGAPIAGRPYLARAAEEHSGPHSPWFWMGRRTGGGALIDMMCHGLEAARWLLTEPGQPRTSLTPIEVTARIGALKWTQPKYADELKRTMGAEVDFANEPSEDYANASVVYVTGDGQKVVTETTTSWSFVGAGLRHTIELLGPEYSMNLNTLDSGLNVFFSRRVEGEAGEDLVEKQNAEHGLMPVVPDEVHHYGYSAENRHFLTAFANGTTPELDFADGLANARLLAACYKSAETGRTIDPNEADLSHFVPAVVQGNWKP